MSIERVVVILTPLFAALAGLLTTFISRAIPGATLSKTDVTALFIVGALTAGTAALKWLHGRQKPTPSPAPLTPVPPPTPAQPESRTPPEPPPVTVIVHPPPAPPGTTTSA